MPTLLERQIEALPGILEGMGYTKTISPLWHHETRPRIMFFTDHIKDILWVGDSASLLKINGKLVTNMSGGEYSQESLDDAQLALDIRNLLPQE
jgi:hypothetical protein